MASQIHQLHPPVVYRNSQHKPTYPPFITRHPEKLRDQKLTLFSSYNNVDRQPTIPTTQKTYPPNASSCTIRFRTLGACKLGISRYPDFDYNAEGGTGIGTGMGADEISVDFDLETLYIPPLTSSTTRFLGLPLPPFLKIDIAPELFRGSINRETGKVDLEFKSKFWFSVGTVYRAPPLMVETVLTSEESKGTIRSGKGKPLDEEGRCRLVGVATVQPIDDFFMNSFLSLPTECLASLNAIISF